MKKLMLGMVAAAAMVACADVESSNIVGYGNNSLCLGYSLITPQFVTVGGSNIALESLVAVGPEVSDNVTMSTIDEYGTPVTTYSWNDWMNEVPGWVDDEYAPYEGVKLAPGMGLWTSGSDATQQIQSAGEVGMSDVVVNLRLGYTLVGNPFPVAVDLQDIVAAGDEASDNVTMSTVDEYGTPVTTYSWNDWMCDTPCWVDEDYAPYEGVKIAPGQSLWTSGSSDTQSIRIPAPEL